MICPGAPSKPSSFLSLSQNLLKTPPVPHGYRGSIDRRRYADLTRSTPMARSYRDTLAQRGLQPFLWTQFLGAFNDNLFKIVVSMLAVHAATQASAGRQL